MGGIAAVIAFGAWGFILGGMLIGGWTDGWIWAPGALFGVLVVAVVGAVIGRLLLRAGLALGDRCFRPAKQ